MTRTASIGSRVPPAVTTTRTPTKSAGPSTRSAAATIRSGEARRPLPTSPPARRPSSGSTMTTPRRRNTARLSCTERCSHISVCIAGHTMTGARVANKVLVSRSVLSPAAYAAMTCAVAGATIMRSARWPNLVCGMGDASSHKLVCTGSLDSAESVVRPIKRSALSVMTGTTWAPASTNRRHKSTALYAAIPPVTPTTMVLPCTADMANLRLRRRCQPRRLRPLLRQRQRQEPARSCRQRSLRS